MGLYAIAYAPIARSALQLQLQYIIMLVRITFRDKNTLIGPTLELTI